MATMTFNDVDLSSLITIMSINRDIGNERQADTNDAPFIGLHIKKIKTSAKIITVDFYLKDRTNEYALNQLKHKLAGIFNVNEQVKVTFSDEPDKYYLAIPINKISASDPIAWLSLVSLELLVPDGVAHSVSYKKITNYRQDGKKLLIDITNNGNVDAHPIITVKHNAENGYLAFVNKSSVFEVGDREIADAEIREKSVVAYDFKDERIVNALTAGKKNVAILNDSTQVLDKNLLLNTVWGRKHLELEGSVAPSGNHAGTLTFDIPDGGSLYDYLWWRQIFWVGTVSQLGFIKIMASDENGHFLYGVETIKRTLGTKTEYNFLVTNGKGGYKITDLRWTFDATHFETQNPFNEPRGWSDMTRADDTVSVFWWGSQNKRVFPELKGKKSKQVHIAIGTIQGSPLVTHMYIDGFYYRKDKVPYEFNIPNAFGAGTEVVINAENDTVLVDNIPKANIIADGFFSFPKIPPGTSTLEVYSSSWSTANPDITLNFEERWL
ncbi:TPA: phage tail family protein [Streptococcus pyogenes]|nr:phage tail family protein [Streptococcus pyogenes]HER7871802.1 phage tail family protein [Streptococcus pyogenes]HER8354079.1 phage tail family protein [Streptococcus pyogenes]HER8441661.1 phage tail family protein [Streptococcus pyogenes]HER8539788.1 phage tail family protein [Streptococcus pyogenes]